MRAKIIAFVMIVLFNSVLYGQTEDRVLPLSVADTEQDIQGILAVIGGITEVQQVSRVTGQPAVAVRGTAHQLELAGWLIKELDQPTTPQNEHEYRISSSTNDLVRIFYLRQTETVQHLNEAATLIRSIGEMRRLFTYSSRRAIALRGTEEQIALADWLLRELDKPTDSSKHEFPLSASVDDLVRVFHLKHSESAQDFNELATLIRSIGQMRRLFTDNSQRALALRGTPVQIALAEWMINELDKPTNHLASQNSAQREYRLSSGVDDHIGLFYLRRADVVETANRLRAQGQMQSVFTYRPQRAIAVRGTANQIAVADGLTSGR